MVQSLAMEKPDEHPVAPGTLVRRSRGERSLLEMAKLLECSESFLSRVERGEKRPGLEHLGRWEAVTSVPGHMFYPELAAMGYARQEADESGTPAPEVG